MHLTDCTNFLSVRSVWMQVDISALFTGSPDPNSDELASARSHVTQSDEKKCLQRLKKKKKLTQTYYSSDLVMTL